MLIVKVGFHVEAKARKKGLRKFVNIKPKQLKTFTHICKICLSEINAKEHATNMSWMSALCKQANTANAESHLAGHSNNERVKKYFKKKEQRKGSTGALSSGNVESGDGGALVKSLICMKKITINELMTKWMVYNHVPHNVTLNPEFRELMQFLDPKFVPFERRTFIAEMEKMFKSMIKGIVKLLNHNGIPGLVAVSITHDIWNTLLMDGALGSSVRVVTSEMEVYTIAALLTKHNVDHTAETVAGILDKMYTTRYDLNVKDDVDYIGSDTCRAAQNVSRELNTEQVRIIYNDIICVHAITCPHY